MNLQDLSDVHTGRYTQRIQYDIQRTAVWKEWHILYRKYTGNNTLVTMTTSHLITNGDFSLLCDIDTYCLIYSRRQLVTIFSCKYFASTMIPYSPCGTFKEVSRTSLAFSPKIARSSLSSAVSSVSPFGVTLPTRYHRHVPLHRYG